MKQTNEKQGFLYPLGCARTIWSRDIGVPRMGSDAG